MSTAVPIIRGKGEGERLWFAGGGVHVWKATAEETDGAFLLVEDRMTQGKTTPEVLKKPGFYSPGSPTPVALPSFRELLDGNRAAVQPRDIAPPLACGA